MRDKGLKPTQTAAAKLIGVSQPSVNDWNEIDGYPTMANAIELGRKLNVCVEWLFTERGPKRPIPADAAAQRLWDVWTQLDDVTKGELIGIALGRLRSTPDSDAASSRSA